MSSHESESSNEAEDNGVSTSSDGGVESTVSAEGSPTLSNEAVDSGLSEAGGSTSSKEERRDVSKNESTEKIYNLSTLTGINKLVLNETEDVVAEEVKKHVQKLISESDVCKKYNCFIFFDSVNSISRVHAERLYSSMQVSAVEKDIAVFLRSRGGKVESAYLISKLCNRFKKNKFAVVIPAEAKSAATLLSLGADEIHMGPMSELGPIDPQVDGLPLLSVQNALEKIASLVEKYPGSADMFSTYLNDNLKIGILGYYDRIAESASQYAQRLLKGKPIENNKTVETLASHFTNHYKDHRFVIDIEESRELLGGKIVLDNTDLYKFSAKLLGFFNDVEFAYLLKGVKKNIVYVGGSCDVVNDNGDEDISSIDS